MTESNFNWIKDVLVDVIEFARRNDLLRTNLALVEALSVVVEETDCKSSQPGDGMGAKNNVIRLPLSRRT